MVCQDGVLKVFDEDEDEAPEKNIGPLKAKDKLVLTGMLLAPCLHGWRFALCLILAGRTYALANFGDKEAWQELYEEMLEARLAWTCAEAYTSLSC